ncbi:hypothetical protein ACJMK2_037933 [Sinanodonta woodiana]|uniref:Uncharacterized protein n=1 Tax=Sinanodonta woodiana TaxID=1069815 RepID=A0ABD3WQF1_SINWO
MATPSQTTTGHIRRTQPNDDEDDPVEKMLKKSGCLELHYAVQECIADKKDWRQCQGEVQKFRQCIQEHEKLKKKG